MRESGDGLLGQRDPDEREERFLTLLALGDIPVVHPHSLPHHFALILHVCYLLPGIAGG